ncbi:hypothetical protein BDR26DRAFT_933478 [Obelidium mucronatum]|nr:hypothetical protein BDR26DRAFT_933478 [Obelidium mucronatum]
MATTDSEDVMKFLDGIDDLVAPTSSVTSSPAKPPVGTPLAAASKTPLPSTASPVKADAADVLSFLDDLDKPNSTVLKQQPPAAPAPVSGKEEEEVEEAVVVEPNEPSVSSQAWGWAGSLWSSAQATASKVSSTALTTAVSSLQMAEAMVEETLTNEKVKGIVTDMSSTVSSTVSGVSGVVNRETVGKLTQDLSKFAVSTANTIGDVIAPPIESPSYRGANSSISHLLFTDASNGAASNLPPVANTITIWLCAELQEEAAVAAATTEQDGMVAQNPADMIHDFVQGTANSLWLHGGGAIPGGSGRAIGKRIVVNSVTDPSPRPARGVQEAVKVIEATVSRLQKLADANDAEVEAETPGAKGSPNATLYLIIQPYTTLIPSPLSASGGTPGLAGSATALHRHYLTMLVNPKTKNPGLDVVSAVSQSVRADKGGRMFGGKEMAPALKKLMEKWSEEQVMRVVEVAVNDVLEEFSLRAKGVDTL